MPPPKVYRGPSTSDKENVVDGVDSDASTNLTNVTPVNPDSDAVADSGMLACDDVDGTLSYSLADGDSAETSSVSAGQLSSTLVDANDLLSAKGTVTTHNHCGEGAWNAGLENDSDYADTCDTVAGGENNEAVDRLSGDADADTTVCERCKIPIDDDSDKSPAVPESLISAPINIPGCSETAVINGGDCGHLQRQLGSTAEDAKPPTPLTSDEVGSGSPDHFTAFYKARRKSLMSNPRFTPAGSFIIPADEIVCVNLSSGLFSDDPIHIGRVQDVSTLPSPPQRPFTIGDSDQTDLLYFSTEETIATALTRSGQSIRSWTTCIDDEEHHSDSEVSKQGSTSPVDVKVEMRDATPREVLKQIFDRTSGEFLPLFYDLFMSDSTCRKLLCAVENAMLYRWRYLNPQTR